MPQASCAAASRSEGGCGRPRATLPRACSRPVRPSPPAAARTARRREARRPVRRVLRAASADRAAAGAAGQPRPGVPTRRELAHERRQRRVGVWLQRLAHQTAPGTRSSRLQQLQVRQHLAHRQLADLLRRPAKRLREPECGLRQRVFDGARDLFLRRGDAADARSPRAAGTAGGPRACATRRGRSAPAPRATAAP